MKPVICFFYHEPSAVAQFHLRCVRKTNRLPIVLICPHDGVPFPGESVVADTGLLGFEKHRNSATVRGFLNWWRTTGGLSYDSFIWVEYDTLVRRPLLELFGPIPDVPSALFAAETLKWPDPWGWWDKLEYMDVNAEGGRLKPYLRGIKPLTGVFVGRKVVEDSLALIVQDRWLRNLHSEMCLATAACTAGYEAAAYGNRWITCGDLTDYARWVVQMPPFAHAVKSIIPRGAV